MKVGVQLPEVERVVRRDELAAMARAAEETGFDSLWVGDHLLYHEPERGPWDCWTTLAWLAGITERVELGPLVAATAFHPPGVIARMAAAVDELSGGRFVLGIGAGWNEVEAAAYGIDLHATLTERFDAFDEGCQAIIGLLSNEQTTFHGRYVQLTDAYCNPKPIQRPHPPICIGGQGERRTLRSVARFAQHWNYPGGTVEQFASKLDVLHAHCADAGRDPSEITVSTHLRGAPGADGVAEVVDQAKRYRDAGLDLGIVYLQPPHSPAVLDELATALAGV